MPRYCDSCGTKLPNGHGFVTRDGKGLSCGRISVRKSVTAKDGIRSIISVKLPCAKAAGV